MIEIRPANSTAPAGDAPVGASRIEIRKKSSEPYYENQVPVSSFEKPPAPVAPEMGAGTIAAEGVKGLARGTLELATSIGGAGVEAAGQVGASAYDIARAPQTFPGMTPEQFQQMTAARQSQTPTPNPLEGQTQVAQQVYQADRPSLQPDPRTSPENAPYLTTQWGVPQVARLAGEAGSMVPAAAATIGAAAATGGIGPAGAFAGGAMGGAIEGLSEYQQVLESGGKPADALRAAAVMGAGSGALNAIPFVAYSTKFLPKGMRNSVGKAMISFLAEGATETAEGGVSAISRMNKLPKSADEWAEAYSKIEKGVIDESNVFLVAGLMGGGTSMLSKDDTQPKTPPPAPTTTVPPTAPAPPAPPAPVDALQPGPNAPTPNAYARFDEDNAPWVPQEQPVVAPEATNAPAPIVPAPEQQVAPETPVEQLSPEYQALLDENPELVALLRAANQQPTAEQTALEQSILSQDLIDSREAKPPVEVRKPAQPLIEARPALDVGRPVEEQAPEPQTAREKFLSRVSVRAQDRPRPGNRPTVTPEPTNVRATVRNMSQKDVAPAVEPEPKPAATFKGMQPRPRGQEPIPLYNIPDGKGGQTTVSAETAAAQGYSVPEPPVEAAGLGMPPIVSGMIDAGIESVSDLRNSISDVKYGPINDSDQQTIEFNVDGKPYTAILTGRNEELMLGFGKEKDAGIATRALLDGNATPVEPEAPTPTDKEKLAAKVEAVKGASPVSASANRAAMPEQREGTNYEKTLGAIGDTLAGNKGVVADVKPVKIYTESGSVITRSARNPGKFQVTHFTDKGAPAGHEEYDTLFAAIKENPVKDPLMEMPKNGSDDIVRAAVELEDLGNTLGAYGYSSPNRPLGMMSPAGRLGISTNIDNQRGVVFTDSALSREQMESNQLFPITKEARDAAIKEFVDAKYGSVETPQAPTPTTIRAAALDIAGAPETRVRLADLREKLGGTREQQDAALLDMQKSGDLVLMRNDDPQDITPRDEAAKLMLSGERRDLVYVKAEKPTTQEKVQALREKAGEKADNIVARTTPKLAMDGETDFYREWRVRQLSEEEYYKKSTEWDRRHSTGRWVVEGRRVDIKDGKEVPTEFSDWKIESDFATTEKGAILKAYEGVAGDRAEGVHPHFKKLKEDAMAKRASAEEKKKNEDEKFKADQERRRENETEIAKGILGLKTKKVTFDWKSSETETDSLSGLGFGDFAMVKRFDNTDGNNYQMFHMPSGKRIGTAKVSVKQARELLLRLGSLEERWDGSGEMPTNVRDSMKGQLDAFKNRDPLPEQPAPKPKRTRKPKDTSGFVNVGAIKEIGGIVFEAATKPVVFEQGFGAAKPAVAERRAKLKSFEMRGKHIAMDFDNGFRKLYKRLNPGLKGKLVNRFASIPDKIVNQLNDYLEQADPDMKAEALMELPPELREPAVKMRELIDNMTDYMLSLGIVEDEQGMAFADNKGVYLRRTYDIFTDPDFRERRDPRLKETLRKWLKKQHPDYSDYQIEGIITDLDGTGLSATSTNNMIARGKALGQMDRRTLGKREDIPQEVMDFWGVSRNGYDRFLDTINSQAHVIANYEFLSNMAENLDGVSVATASTLRDIKRGEYTGDNADEIMSWPYLNDADTARSIRRMSRRRESVSNKEQAIATALEKLGKLPDSQKKTEMVEKLRDDALMLKLGLKRDKAGVMSVDPENLEAAAAYLEALTAEVSSLGKKKGKDATKLRKDLDKYTRQYNKVEGEAATDENLPNMFGSFGPLAGARIHPDLKKALQDALAIKERSEFVDALRGINSQMKQNVTTRNPASAVRNLTSGFDFSMANGWILYGNSVSRLKEAMKVASVDITRAHDPNMREEYLRAVELGVAGDTVVIGDITATAANAKKPKKIRDFIRKYPEIAAAMGGPDAVAQKLYQAGDDVFKIFGWLTEKEHLMDIGMSEREAELEAAARVRRQFPTYSELPKWAQWFKASPVVGPFVAYKTETYRTAYNTVVQAVTEVKNKNPDKEIRRKIQRMGFRRLAGIGAASISRNALKIMLFAAFAIDPDDEDAIQMAAPVFYQDHTLGIVKANKAKGLYEGYNLSTSDAYNVLKEPMYAALRGEGVGETVSNAAITIGRDYISPEMGASLIAELLANIQGKSSTIFKKSDTAGEKWLKSAMRVGLDVGVPGGARGFLKAETPEDMINEAVTQFTGLKTIKIDMPNDLLYKARALTAIPREQATDVYKQIRAKDITGAKAEIAKVNQTRKEQFMVVHKAYRAYVSAGTRTDLLDDALKQAGLSKKSINNVKYGQYEDWEGSKPMKEALGQ